MIGRDGYRERGISGMSTPPLTVVVLPVLGGPTLGSLLAHLAGEADLPAGSEVLVAGGEATIRGPAHARWIPAGGGDGRNAGVRAAQGSVVALLDDTTRPLAGWGEAVVALHARFVEAAGIAGTLIPAPILSPLEAALLALEHGSFFGARAVSAPVSWLPDTNASFKRDALEGGLTAELLQALGRRVGTLRCESAMAAVSVGVNPAWRTVRGCFARGLARGAESQRRDVATVARLAAAPLLAASRCVRAATRLGDLDAAARRRALAHLAWASQARALGEGVGSLIGVNRVGGPPSPLATRSARPSRDPSARRG
jgi:hypothetical protein